MPSEPTRGPATLWTEAFQTWMEGWASNAGLRTGPDDPPADPFQLWNRAFDRWFEGWGAVLDQALTTPEAAEASGRVLDAMLNVEKPIREQTAAVMRRWLQLLNMPAREEFLRLAVQVNEANARLDELRDLVEDLSDQVAALAAHQAIGQPAATLAGGAA